MSRFEVGAYAAAVGFVTGFFVLAWLTTGDGARNPSYRSGWCNAQSAEYVGNGWCVGENGRALRTPGGE